MRSTIKLFWVNLNIMHKLYCYFDRDLRHVAIIVTIGQLWRRNFFLLYQDSKSGFADEVPIAYYEMKIALEPNENICGTFSIMKWSPL